MKLPSKIRIQDESEKRRQQLFLGRKQSQSVQYLVFGQKDMRQGKIKGISSHVEPKMKENRDVKEEG